MALICWVWVHPAQCSSWGCSAQLALCYSGGVTGVLDALPCSDPGIMGSVLGGG